MKIGVVGTKGGWSSERLADKIEEMTGFRLLVEMVRVELDLETGKASFDGWVLNDLDGLIVKKIGAKYSPLLLDRLEILRFLNERGLKIYSSPLNIMKVLNRLSCTITLKVARIPMPPTTVTECRKRALETVNRYGSAVFKPLYTSKARGMRVIKQGDTAWKEIEIFNEKYKVMYIQKKIDLGSKDLGLVFEVS